MRCPTCGSEVGSLFGNPHDPESYNRMLAQAQNRWYQNQMAQGLGMQNAYANSMAYGGPMLNSSNPEPSEPEPPKPLTAWQQFKVLIREIFP
jgi:hypothetical protein